MAAVSALGASRRISGCGTPESVWRRTPELVDMPRSDVEELLAPGRRVVVVAPHPDDEVIGCGGLLAASAGRSEREVVIVGVSDGEAAYPRSSRWPPGRLAQARRVERERGLDRLGLQREVVRLGLPDGQVARRELELRDHLRALLREDDIVLTTWREDGHPDHEACGRAAADVAADRGSTLVEMPIWAWHWATPGDERIPWSRSRRFDLTGDERERKQHALQAHVSQLEPGDVTPPVLPDWALARMLRPFEVFIVEAAR